MKKYIICMLCFLMCLKTFSQNTGIGTTTPAAKLEVKGNGTTSSTTTFQATNSAGIPLFNVEDNGDVQILNKNLIVNSSTGAIIFGYYPTTYWYTATNGGGTDFLLYSQNASGNNTRLYMDGTNGNVGIGTFIPSDKLQVNGSLNIAGPLKISGVSGTAGQVLTSNGTSAPSWQNIPTSQVGFSARLTSTQNVSPSIFVTPLPYTLIFDDGSGLNTTTGAYTVPSTGLYHFNYRIDLGIASGSATNFPVILRAFKNGSVIVGGQSTSKIDVNTNYGESVELNCDVKLLAGDVITVQVFQNSGVTLIASGGGSSSSTIFSGYKIY